MPATAIVPFDDTGKVDERKYVKTRIENGELMFNGVHVPKKNKWVRFLKDHEDGVGIFRKDQIAEITDKVRLRQYLEFDVVVPSDPPKDTKVDMTRRAKYVFTESTASPNADYQPGKVYELPCHVGDKFTERGLCERIGDAPNMVREKPERR